MAFEQARESYKYGMMPQAIESLLEALRHDSEYIDAYLTLSQVYGEVDSLRLQIETLGQAFALDSACFPPGYIARGEALQRSGRYAEALADIDHFLAHYANLYERHLPLVGRLRENCLFAIEALAAPLDIDLQAMPPEINTDDHEYWPSFTVDNAEFYFTRQRIVGGRRVDEDIWTSDAATGHRCPRPLGEPVNTPDNEGAPFVSPDGRYLLFTGCNRPGGLGSCDIYMSVRGDEGWLPPRNLGANVNSKWWESRPVISSDGAWLYFASNRPGGFGKSDIYRCRAQGHDAQGFPTWGDPENLGATINTPGDETAPFIHPDNATLYFSSDYHTGMGGQDILKSTLVDGRWSKPRNLGPPINSHRNEIGIFVQSNGATAYVEKEVGENRQCDIYHFELPAELQAGVTTYVNGTVRDKKSGAPLAATVDLADYSTGEAVVSVTSNSQGRFLITLVAGRSYGMAVEREGYLFYSGHFAITGDSIESYHLTIELEPIEIGSRTILNNVLFATNSHELSPESLAELNRVVRLLEANPAMRIEISGHTDNRGAEELNRGLSERRSKAVHDYITAKGIDAKRLTYKGYGASRPIAGNDTDQGRAKNRRTEMTITHN